MTQDALSVNSPVSRLPRMGFAMSHVHVDVARGVVPVASGRAHAPGACGLCVRGVAWAQRTLRSGLSVSRRSRDCALRRPRRRPGEAPGAGPSDENERARGLSRVSSER